MSKKSTPLSQDEKKITVASKQDCIKELRRIAEIDVTKIITRNFFRNNSKYAESAWSKHFGTFEEFKRAANIIPSRFARGMETSVARHASVDAMREMNKQKMGFEGKYLKPSGKRYQTIMVASDIHDIECDPFWRFLFLDTLKRVKPQRIILNGDVFDLPEFGSYPVDPREWDVVGRIQWVHKFLEEIRNICPDAEIDFIEGNHEYRLLRHLGEASPAMKAVLSDLHGWTVPKLLGLDKYQLNYIAPADLATFTKADAKAELHDAQSTLVLREADLKRMEALKKVEAVKKYDEAKAAFEIAKAKIEIAKARLAKTQIIAPFDGVIGLIEPSPGAYVQAAQEMATVVDNNPMKVDFKIPERNLHEVGIGQGIEIKLDGFPDQIFTATVEAIDSKVDHQSHSIAVRGTIPNAKELLRGGLFANVSLIVGEKGDALLVPESALEREGDIEYVWVVKRNKASRKRVLVGTKEKNKVEIITGINPGEIVVTAGQMRFAGDGHPVKLLNLNEDGSEKPDAEKKKLEDAEEDDE